MELTVKGIHVRVTFWFSFCICYLLCIARNEILFYAVLFSLLHECGHLLVCLYCKAKPKEICFSILGMTMVEGNDEKISYREERFIALGGPLVNLLFLVGFLGCFLFTERETYLTLLIINGFIFLFNSLPIFSLDGGRVLLFTLLLHIKEAEHAYKIEKIVSLIFIILLLWIGFFVLFKTKYNVSLLLLSFYLLLVLYKKC